MRCLCLLLLTAWFVIPLTGCASYTPVPISPAASAQSLDSRTLDNSRLQKFIAAELGGASKEDPPPTWDLSTLTLAAIYYHPDIAIAHAKLASAEAGVITARQRPNPSLTLTNVFGQAAVAAAATPAGAATITVGPMIDFLIETFGKREDRTAQARYLADAARWDLSTAGWQVRARVRTALLDLWVAQKRLALTHQQLNLQEELVTLLEQRFAVGEASSVDVMLARVARAQITLSLRNLEQTQATARVQLATALGVPAHALDGLVLSLGAFDYPPPVPSHPDTGKLRREALTMRTDVQADLQDYEAAQSALQLQVANQYPNITLSPGYNYDFGVNKYILGLGADQLPILNQNQGPIAEALANRQQAAANFTGLQAQIIGAIDEAAAAYRTATRSVATGDALLADEQNHEKQIASQFRVGQVDRVTLVTAELEVAATALSRFDAVERQRQAIGALEDALQQPLFDPGHWPTVPSEQNAILSHGESSS
ncbi:MAG: TolC family protein [Paraburkholderia sp.]|nr:MAG: TolC family protein [Paraburkholderia sp.]